MARELLGKKLFHNVNGEVTSGLIIETEAYLGISDPACHTFNGRRTSRVESMYKVGGYSYVYLIYGLHCCFNIVTQDEKKPEAVLIRALFPDKGLEIMKQRRRIEDENKIKNLCSGPGKLCEAMRIDRKEDGLLLTGSKLWITEGLPFLKIKPQIESGPRVGVDYAGDAKNWPLRFLLTI